MFEFLKFLAEYKLDPCAVVADESNRPRIYNRTQILVIFTIKSLFFINLVSKVAYDFGHLTESSFQRFLDNIQPNPGKKSVR